MVVSLKDESMALRLCTLVVCLVLSSCLQSPRSSLFREQSSSPSEQSKSQRAREVPEGPRFQDTSYQRIVAPSATAAVDAFAAAQQDFDQQHYEDAQRECEQLLGTLDDADSLHAEAAMLKAECCIQRNRLEDAVGQLKALRAGTLTADQTERSMLRLGQVYCLLGQSDQAKLIFNEFRQRFAQSKYLPLASCAAIR